MTSLAVPILFLLLALRIWRRGVQQRRVRVETMWIGPLVFVVLIGSWISADPPPVRPGVLSLLAVALVLGLVVGWFRAAVVRITADTETHTLTSQTSAIGLVMLAGLFLARQAVRTYLDSHAAAWDLSPVAVADGFLVLALGMVVGQRMEILLRCLRLLRQGRKAEPAGGEVGSELTQSHATDRSVSPSA